MAITAELEQAFKAKTRVIIDGSPRQVPSITDNIGNGYQPKDERTGLWAGWAPNYSKLLALREIDQTWQSFVNLVPQTQSKYIHLDAGCGNGEIISRVVRRAPNARIVGVDLSPEFLGETQRRIGTQMTEAMGRVALYRADLTKRLPFENETFKVATMNLVFQYLSKEEQQEVYQNMAPVMEQGGTFLMSTFTEGHTFGQLVPGLLAREVVRGNIGGVVRILKYLGIPRKFSKLREAGVMNHPSVEDLEEWSKQAGFSKFEVAGPMFGKIGVFTVATK